MGYPAAPKLSWISAFSQCIIIKADVNGTIDDLKKNPETELIQT